MAGQEAQDRALIKDRCSSDLSFLWIDSAVSLRVQAQLVGLGYVSVKLFTGLADSKTEVRAALLADLQLDPGAQPPAGPAARVQVAAVLSAWSSAAEMVTRESQLRAEAKTLGVTRSITVPEQRAMKRIFESAHGPLPEGETPSNDYLSAKLEEVEQDHPTASTMDDITSAEEAETSTMTTCVDLSNRIVVTKKRGKGRLPSDPHEFQLKLRIEASTWIFIGAKFSNKAYLQGITPQVFSRYCDHFLGKKCLAMDLPQADGSMDRLHPAWTLVLHYELQCRKRAFQLVRDTDATLVQALEAAISCPELKELHFTWPCALSASAGRKAKTPAWDPSLPPPALPPGAKWKRPKKKPKVEGGDFQAGKGKGGGKGDKGGKAPKGASKGDLVSVTPDGRQLCFAYSSAEGCRTEGCERVHACRVKGCLGLHPMHAHAAAHAKGQNQR